MFVIVPALIGAIVGAGITLFFNMWKFHRDERGARCDEICKAAQDAAKLALEYWVTDFKSHNDQIVAETKLQAAQNLLELLFDDFAIYVSKRNEDQLSKALSDFTKLITGGQYSELGRPSDVKRAKLTGPLANKLSVDIRRANRETLPFHNSVLAFHSNKRRVLDMPVSRCGIY